MAFLLTGLIFLLSGMAGLADEIVWFRMLTTVFGASAPAIAATTGAFMAGLAAGSAAASKRKFTPRKAAAAYAVLEGLIALCALAMPAALRIAGGLPDFVGSAADQPLLRSVVRFTTVFLLLLLPTALMGATVPVMAATFARSQRSHGSHFAWLYSMNTFGAVLGALLTGFVLIPQLGLTGTIQLAAACNCLAAVAAWVLLRPLLPRGEAADEQPAAAAADTLIASATAAAANAPAVLPSFAPAVAACVAGFVSLAAQHLWSRSLVFGFDRLKNTTYSFSAVLAVCLLGIATGALLWATTSRKLASNPRIPAWITLLFSVAITLSVLLLLTLPKLRDDVDPATLQVDFPRAVLHIMVRTLAIAGLPTFLSGLLLPACVQFASVRQSLSIGRIYAWNAMGSVIGAAAAPFAIVPVWGLFRGLLVLAAIAAAAGCWLLWPRRFAAIFTAVAAALTALMFVPQLPAPDTLLPGEFVVRAIDGPTASVSIIENPRGERRISVDDVPVAGTSLIMQTDQKSLAHWGMLLADQPHRALTVGFGSGGASASFLMHDELQALDCVEISPEVPSCADLLTDANGGLLQRQPPDPRYRIIFEDARAYLRAVHGFYDVIVSDCTDLRYRSSANLYDREYFELCRQASTETGCTVIWMPLGGLSRDAFLLTLRTFANVFPDMQVYYLNHRWTHYVLLAGRKQPWVFPADRVKQMLAEEDVRRDLALIGFSSAHRIAATLLTNAAALGEDMRKGPLNTEETPLLEFLVPRTDTGPDAAQRNLNLLRGRSVSITRFLPENLAPDELDRYSRYALAARRILLAQEAARRTDVETATLEYLAARELTPEDQSLSEYLEFPELQTAAEAGNPTAWLLLARSFQLQNRIPAALQLLQRYRDGLELLRRSQPGSPNRQHLPQAEAWESSAALWYAELQAAGFQPPHP